jgi:hypothetical protein
MRSFWSLGFVSSDPIPSPDGKSIAFVSDRDGWDHLYVVPAAGGAVTQITKGAYEVRDVSWSPDASRIIFTTNEGDNPGTWHLGIAALGGGPANARIEKLTSGRGTNVAPRWAPDGKRIVYQHTDSRTLGRSLSHHLGGDRSRRAGASERLDARVDRSLGAGAAATGSLSSAGRPAGSRLSVRPSRAGSVEEASGHCVDPRRRHQPELRRLARAAQLRRFITAFTNTCCSKVMSCLRPITAAASATAATGGKVCTWMSAGRTRPTRSSPRSTCERCRMWMAIGSGCGGLSYGGYFMLIALADRPTLYACGVDVAGVGDYRTWFMDPGGAWVISRMGTPTSNPNLYQESAVAESTERSSKRPWLVSHGTADVNVPLRGVVRVLDELLKHGKQVEAFMMKPCEFPQLRTTRAHSPVSGVGRVDAFLLTGAPAVKHSCNHTGPAPSLQRGARRTAWPHPISLSNHREGSSHLFS